MKCPGTILIVDDERLVRDLLKLIIAPQGYRVLSAHNAEQAMAIARAWRGEPIDLLLTDLAMPGMSGDELARKLCGLLPSLKVIFISGYPPNDPVVAQLNLNDAIYLQKPIGSGVLAEAIEKLLHPGLSRWHSNHAPARSGFHSCVA